MNRKLSALLLGALAGWTSACGPGHDQAAGASRLNVLLVTFDTTRADHLACYGHPRAHTPTLDRLAAEGALFENALAALPVTLPSHTSILTGLYPPAHGVRDNGLFALPEAHLTLAEILRREGWATAAAVASYPLLGRFGLAQGFDLYDDNVDTAREDIRGRPLRQPRLFFDERPAGRVNAALRPWLEEQVKERPSQPFFAWAHYYDPHHPLRPPAPWDALFADNPYLGEIAYADESLGTLLGHLERLGVLEKTLIVFTSDHGEGLGEHGETTHSMLLYQTTLHVPLILRLPNGLGNPAHTAPTRGRRVRDRVRSVDILPTVLELLDIEVPTGLHGRSLVPFLGARPPTDAPPRPHYAETLTPRLTNGWGELRALYDGRFKYVHGPRRELFDLEADPRELDDLAARQPERTDAMQHRLAALLGDLAAGGGMEGGSGGATIEVDAETRRRLLALGYLQSGGDTEIREELREDGRAPQEMIDVINNVFAAKDLLSRGRPLEAREAARRLHARDPESPYALEILAHAEANLGRFEQALEHLDALRASGASPESAAVLLARLGELLVHRGEVEAGLERMRQGATDHPNAEVWSALARALAKLGQETEAENAWDAALEADPTWAPARLELAVRLARRGETERAGEELRRVVKDRPYLARGHYNLGTWLLENGQSENALARFERALELAPSYAEAAYGAFAVELLAGREDAAQERLATLETRRPESAEAVRARQLWEEYASAR